MNVVSQFLTDANFGDPSTHIVPWVRFTATLLFAAVARWGAPRCRHSAEQERLMWWIGLFDAMAYTAFCLGFVICGATLSGLLLAGINQVLTAAATRFLLGRRLSWGQLSGNACVMVGLLIRGLPPSLFGGAAGAGGGAKGGGGEQQLATGMAYIVLSSCLYSGLGIAYDKLVKASLQAPPSHADIMWHTSKLGFCAASSYQVLYTLPRYSTLVAPRLAASSYSLAGIIALLGLVFRTEGAVGVGLISAVRGAVLAIIMGLWFCSPARTTLCLTLQTSLSAAITTLGGVIWVLAAAPAAAPRRAAAPAEQPAKAATAPPNGKQAPEQGPAATPKVVAKTAVTPRAAVRAAAAPEAASAAASPEPSVAPAASAAKDKDA
eukprot:scaffold19.g1819.t1